LVAFPPVLLVQPPNSSSAATFGAGVNPPDAPGTILWLANEPPPMLLPHPPKSLPALGAEGCGSAGLFGPAAVAGPGLLHAFPHTSASDVLMEVTGAEVGGGIEAADGLVWVVERLKTEFEVGAAAGLGAAGVITAGLVGVDQSKRSPKPEDDGWAG
jgi:hypothetical protein